MPLTDRDAYNAYQRAWREKNLKRRRAYNRDWMRRYREQKRLSTEGD